MLPVFAIIEMTSLPEMSDIETSKPFALLNLIVTEDWAGFGYILKSKFGVSVSTLAPWLGFRCVMYYIE